MIQLKANEWLHFEDLAQDVPGREEPRDLSEVCYEYLARRAARQRGLVKAGGVFDLKIRSTIAAAVIRASVAPRTAISASEEQDTIRRQEATINRLLAFVPARANEVSEARLQEIVRDIATVSQKLFLPPAPMSLFLERETDPETVACHRITVTVPIGEGADVAGLVDREVVLRQHLARSLTKLEFSAVRVLIQYESAKAG